MPTISLTITGDTPTGVVLTAVTRLDTNASAVATPVAMTPDGGAWVYAFDDPAPGLEYAYQYRVTWDDATTTDGVGVFGGPSPTDNYYVRKIDVVLASSTELFNKEFRLSPDSTEAEPAVAAEILQEAGDQIDVIAMDVGLPIYTAGDAAGHYLDVNSADPKEQIAFRVVRKQGAKLARALARSLRPDRDDEPRAAMNVLGVPPPNAGADTAGGFAKQKNAALVAIRAALSALMYQRDLVTAQPEDDIFAVGWNDDGRYGCGRFRPYRPLPPGVDADVLF